MILVADSGSTKCDWMLATEDQSIPKFSTMGFNPFFHSKEKIVSTLKESQEAVKYAASIQQVYFYGAGSSSPDRKAHIADALAQFFPKARIEVDHDLIGAAFSTCGDDPGISCILGTGSNSCYFDGKEVYEAVPALGHRLGDEGSGSYFGRKILSKFLYKRLPSYLHEKLVEDYGLTKEVIFENVYRQPNENVYLASFMKSLSDFKDEKWVKELIFDGMTEFVDIHVTCYENYQDVPVHFIGSVSYYFQDILEEVCKSFDIKLGNIIKQPIYNLVDYHVAKSVG